MDTECPITNLLTSISILLLTALHTMAARQTQERILLNTRINGKPARLCFDSGAESHAIFRDAAERLGVKFKNPQNDAAPAGNQPTLSEECELSLAGTKLKTHFLVIPTPAYIKMDVDGLIAWWGVRSNILAIDAQADRVQPLRNIPRVALEWKPLQIDQTRHCLMLQIPHTTTTNGALFIDTGTESGVCLPQQKWVVWRASHRDAPTTLHAFFTAAAGVKAAEQAWAQQVAFGPLILTEVPVEESFPEQDAFGGPNFEGTLGLAALKRIDLIVDGTTGTAYIRPSTKPPSSYNHNRLGAVFLPKDAASEELVARVALGSPAEEAGVRHGDILLEVDDSKVTIQNRESFRRFQARPGTKVRLTLTRDGKTFQTTAKLRDILGLPQ